MQAEIQHDTQSYGEYYAAVDLGSNSFHMVIVHVVNGSVQIIGKVKQKVRLASGLDDDLALDDISMERGWQCLQWHGDVQPGRGLRGRNRPVV